MSFVKDPTLAEHLMIARLIAMKRTPYWQQEIAAMVPIEVELDKPTLRVRADWVMLVDPRIATEWKPEETATIMCERLLHLWLRHPRRAREIGVTPGNVKQWRKAAAMEIADDLAAAGWPFPASESAILPPHYDLPNGETAEEYFARLVDERDEGTEQDPGGCGGGDGDETEDGQNQGNDGQGNDGQGGGDMDHEGCGKTEAEQEQRYQEMASAVTEAGKGTGKVPGSFLIHAKAMQAKPVDWRKRLSGVVRRGLNFEKGHTQNNWSRFNRRQFGNFLQPTQRNPTPRCAIVVDTSGSMLALLEEALPTVDAIARAAGAEVEYCQCDAVVHELRPVKNLGEFKKGFRGGGGTDFRPAFTMIDQLPDRRRPHVIVFVTDGFGPAPDEAPRGIRTIWAMLGGTNPPAAWGEVVDINQQKEGQTP